MTRSNKLDKPKAPKETAGQLMRAILEDVLATATVPFEDWYTMSQVPWVPLAIPIASSGRQFRVTQVGVDTAHRLAEQVWRDRADLRQTMDRAEFDKLAFRSIGEAILNSRSRLPPVEAGREDVQVDDAFFDNVATDYLGNLDRLTTAARPILDRHVPCHLFRADQAVPSFRVGPVGFLTRSDWIARHVTEPAQLEYVRQVEDREVSRDDLRERALTRDADPDLREAWEILRSLRDFDWVATIRMGAHETRRSHAKASIIVGLAVDVVGLRFEVEDARLFAKAGRQHLFTEDRIATTLNGAFLRGWGSRMPGLGAAPGALAGKIRAELPFLDAAGKVLDVYVQGRNTGAAPDLVERWTNALHWVGEARRETSDFKAVVDYGCAADCLSGAGGFAAAMTTFAEAALNPKDLPTPDGSLSISDAVTKVYREGRNKLAHGEAPGLLEDFSEARGVGDMLLVRLFDVVTIELAAIIDQKSAILDLSTKHAYKALEARLRQQR